MQNRLARVIGHGMGFFVWLGIAGLALIGANLHLRHTRRALKGLRQDLDAPEGTPVPEGVSVPAATAESASSVIAS